MSSRKLTRPERCTFEPSDAPGVIVNYVYTPGQEGKQPTRDDEGQEDIPAYVTVKEVMVNGCDILPWLESHGFDVAMLEEGIEGNHR